MFTRRHAISLAAAVLVLASALPAAAAPRSLDDIKKSGTIRIGVKYDSPPFGYLDPKNNEVKGFDVELARAIAKQILGNNGKVELVQVNSSSRIPMVQNGDIDFFAATATITEARLKEINFSSVYFRAGQSLLVKKGSPIHNYKELGGHSVCTTQGSTPETTIRRLVPSANVQTFETYTDCFTALESGRTESMTTDNGILLGFQQQDPQKLTLTGGLFTFEPYGLGIGKGNEALTKAIDNALVAVQKSGEYARIYKATLGENPPSDLATWFNMSAQAAAEKYTAEQPKKS